MGSGEIVAGPHVRDACARHLRDLGRVGTAGFAYKFDAGVAERAIGFFRTVLSISGGSEAPRPFVPLPWQAFIIGSVFGWVHHETGARRFREAFILTGKGSGKSPLAAGVGLKLLVADDEDRAEVYAAAVDKDQAGILFRDAVAMTRLSPTIDRNVVRSGGIGREFNIAYHRTGSFFRPVSSEASGRGKSGYRPHGVLLDEIHEHPTNAMVEFMRAGTKGRRQALIFMITNAGSDRTSVCYEYYLRSIRVASGELDDDALFSYVCAHDEDEDPFEDPVDPALGFPRSWAKTNPSLQAPAHLRTFQPQYLEEQVRAAKGMPSKESIVRRLNFCEWTDAEAPWIDGDMWRRCEVTDLEVPKGSASLGLDLSQKRDLLAAARAVKMPDESMQAELRFWTPAETLLERERRDRVPYSAWVKNGFLTAVPGRSIDYAFVVRDLEDWLTAEDTDLAFDPWRIDLFQQELDDAGIESYVAEKLDEDRKSGLRLVRHMQGFGGGASESSLWMPASIDALEQDILAGKLKVRWNPCLTWNNASAVIQVDAAGNRKWDKRKATGRIDGIVALSQAVGLARATVEKESSGWRL